jgi:YHS domain-containing protein
MKNLKLISLLLFASFILPSLSYAAKDLKIVANDKVCMVTDMFFGKKQIPVEHKGNTYYGCCENCKATLASDPASRTATDPVTGKSIDKAKAVIAARSDNSVLYFESKATFAKYSKGLAPQKK